MEKVLVGMSGGVDSAAAALLLRQAGYEPVGCTLHLYSGTDAGRPGSCCSLEDTEDARAVAARLGMDFYVFNFKETFRLRVMDDFVAEYRAGRTPNPCIQCNRYIKFDALLRRAQDLDIPRIATGHYARVVYSEAAGRWQLLRGLDRRKDQSYVLYPLTQRQLSRLLLPVGDYDKAAIRAMAEAAGLVNARKPDSQDICFVPAGTTGAFWPAMAGWRASRVTLWTQPVGCWAVTGDRSTIPPASAAAWGSAPTGPCMCCGRRRRATGSCWETSRNSTAAPCGWRTSTGYPWPRHRPLCPSPPRRATARVKRQPRSIPERTA